MNSPRTYRFAVYQFFIFLAAFAFLSKRMSQLLFIGEIGIFALMFIMHPKEINFLFQQKQYSAAIPRIFVIFILTSITYLALSYKGLADFWDINGLFFETKYIPRHFFIIAELIIPVGLCLALYKTDFVYHLSNTILLLIFALSFGARFFGVSQLQTCFLAASSISLYAFRKRKPLYLILVAFIFTAQTAYLIGTGILWLTYFFIDVLADKFKNNTHIKFYILLAIFTFLIYVFIESFMGLIAHDENTLWRWMVWTNETKSLAQTYFTGVGFGTAYVTSDIIYQVDNYNMYIDFDDNSVYDRLFLVANHNSFLNMFYRMGVLGGGLFITLYFYIIRWALSAYNQVDDEQKIYIGWAFSNFLYQTIIILFNPGLEMMQFAIQFLPSVAILMAILIKTQSPVIED